jgi:hypothetical protein
MSVFTYSFNIVLTLFQTMIDRKLEPLIKKLMVKHLGELEDDDLILFVLEHLKDHKGPAKLVEGLEPVCCPLSLSSDPITGSLCRFWRKRQLSSPLHCGVRSSSKVWLMGMAFIQRR